MVLHILRASNSPMGAHAIYAAGSFDYEQLCYNQLYSLYQRDILTREKVDGVYHYRIADDADIPQYLLSDMEHLAQNGMPQPDPDRRMGQSRAEYTSKRSVTETKSVTITEERTAEVVEPDAPVHLIAPPQAQKRDGVYKPSSQLALLGEFQTAQELATAKVNAMHLMMELTSGGTRLAELLNDYIEFLYMGGTLDDKADEELVKNRLEDAELFAKGAVVVHDIVFAAASEHLADYAVICEDVENEDAAELHQLACMLGRAA